VAFVTQYKAERARIERPWATPWLMKRVLGIVAVTAIGVVAWLLFNQREQAAARATSDGGAPSAAATQARGASPLERQDSPPSGKPRTPRRVTPERRLEIIRALAVAEAARSAQAAVQEREGRRSAPVTRHELPEEEPSDHQPGETRLTSKEYLKQRIDDLRPLIEECYAEAKRVDPSVPDVVPVAFTIGADPDIGGVVTEAAVQGTELERRGSLAECVRETLYTLEIDPPANGGEVKVVYPFEFGEKPDPSQPGSAPSE
jgi:hypothetical protein